MARGRSWRGVEVGAPVSQGRELIALFITLMLFLIFMDDYLIQWWEVSSGLSPHPRPDQPPTTLHRTRLPSSSHPPTPISSPLTHNRLTSPHPRVEQALILVCFYCFIYVPVLGTGRHVETAPPALGWMVPAAVPRARQAGAPDGRLSGLCNRWRRTPLHGPYPQASFSRSRRESCGC